MNSALITQANNIKHFKKGEILCYTRYEDDLINYPYLKPNPDKYFKVTKVDMGWGVVYYNYYSERYNKTIEDSIGIAYVRKTSFWEKIIWFLCW